MSNEFPATRGLAYPDIIEAAVAKRIRALWIIATNPIVSFPNFDVLAQAFRQLEFLVVQDGFHPTPTSELAHLVLPAAIWGEKEGTYTNSERRVSKVNPAVAPPGEALPDFDIFLRLAEHLGCEDRLFPGWTSPAHAFDEWRNASAGRLCDYSGMTYELLDETGGIQWPFPAGAADPAADAPSIHRWARSQPTTAAPICSRSNGQPFPEQPNTDFPFVLNTGRTVEHWHTRTKTGGVPILEGMSPRAWLEMNPRDAKRSG